MIQQKKDGRIENLDYFRGIAASSIMIYHFLYWSYGRFNAEDLQGRIGIYGVSVFYILSGLTMFIVYEDKIKKDLTSVLDFFFKRIVRIFPLLWLATTLTILISLKHLPSVSTILLNYSGLFGFIKPWDYIGNGVWSIGNELVFYIFFPIFVLSYKFLKPIFWAITGSIAILMLYFAFHIFDTAVSLESQWHDYVNPFNQIHLFLGGFLIGIFFQKININKMICRLLLLLGLLLFCFYPLTGDRICLVAGWGRISFSFICFLITIAIYKDNYELKGLFKKFMLFLGEASYSIYLLHQIVFFCVNGVSLHACHFNKVIIIVTSVALTFILSFFVYSYFEKPSMEKGRRMIRKILYKN